METIKLQTMTDDEGILHLELPLGLLNTKLEVVVVLQPIQTGSTLSKEAWLKLTYGSLRDVDLEIGYEGDYEQREAFE